MASNGDNLPSRDSVSVVSRYSEDILNGRPSRGRKRKVPGQSRQDRKHLYNNNKTHVNSKGQLVLEKKFDENFSCSCRKKCTDIVHLDERKRLFSQFWSMGSLEARCALLITCLSKNKHGKYKIYKIFEQNVCRRALLRTLQINKGRIKVALKKMKSFTYADGRGQTSGGRNALPQSKKDEVRSHIASFPKYISHYTRNVTESKFLNPNLNLAKMYRLYKIKFQNPVSKSLYKRIFYKNFNLRFKTPKKDTCKKCDTYKVQAKNAVGLTRHMLENWHNNHLEQADLLTNLMKSDLKEAEYNPWLEVVSYDMQKTLSLPRMPTNIIYYLRQLNLYNFGIHVGTSGKGLFHVWLESEALKGTQEVGSCLRKFIETIAAAVKKLILWSDSCGGQNRSIRLVLMMIYVLQHHPSLETISLRYLQSGHSFMPNDSEFGDFECELKRHEKVCTDNAYIKIMQDCRIENKFEVIRMSPEDFFSIKEMEVLITNRKVDIEKQKISWLDTHEIQLDKFQPNIIKMKNEIGDDFQTVDIRKVLRGAQKSFESVELGQLYPNGRALSKEKLADLKKMMPLVDDEDKYFYEFLGFIEERDFHDDVDGYGEGIDFEIEEE